MSDVANSAGGVFHNASPPEVEGLDLDAALNRAIRQLPSSINAHLQVLQRDIQINSTAAMVHCYFLPLDGNRRVRFKPLAEFLRDRIVDYAIPRRTIEQAKRLMNETGSTAPIVKLHAQARNLFTDLANTGEGGELLLFAMAEAVFGLPQILCKMSLKTSTSMHYHGADGVYAEARPDGGLNIYWGESKIYSDATTAIRDCLASLAPFLVQPSGEDAVRDRDILLVNEFANFTDQRLVDGLRKFIDRDDPASLTTTHCGFALTAFDSASYPAEGVDGTLSAITSAIRSELPRWTEAVARRVEHERLSRFHIHFLCVPLPSAEEFRSYFLKLLGK